MIAMKKRLISCLLFLLSAILPLVAGDPAPRNTAPVEGSDLGCPLPPPGWLITTNITATSVSLKWEQAQVVVYYKVEGYDNTGGFALPTYYTSNNTHTYTGLIPGHSYDFMVSASSCPEGPPGQPLVLPGIKTIIIEFIVSLQNPCNPTIPQSTGNGVTHGYCAQQSDYEDPPYNDAFVGRLTYDNKNLRFGMAVVESKIYLGELNDSDEFSFEPTNSNTEAQCVYTSNNQSTLLFTIKSMSMFSPVDEAGFYIEFEGNYGNFYFCNGACTSERSSDTNDESLPGADVSVSPNPFSESATVQYRLSEAGPVSITLFDAVGRVVRVIGQTDSVAAGEYTATIGGNDLPDGAYFLQVMTGQHRAMHLLVKQQ